MIFPNFTGLPPSQIAALLAAPAAPEPAAQPPLAAQIARLERLLAERSPQTRAELARAAKVAESTIHNWLQAGIEQGRIRVAGRDRALGRTAYYARVAK